MNELLGETLFDFTDVLVDDILVSSNSYEEHLRHLEDVLGRLAEQNVTLNIAKCEFAAIQMLYIGHVIDRYGIHVDPKKVKAIADWAPPKTKKEVLSFNGAVNYLRRFIPNCSKYTGPLADLTSDAIPTKDVTKYWTETHTACFNHLKAALASAPVLAYPDFSQPFQIETDASDTCVGGVLTQEKFDAVHRRPVLRPVAYFSAKLNPAQCRYDAPTREALAIVLSLEHFKHYLNLKPVRILTDHEAHRTLATRTDAHDRLARWRYRISEFQFEIVYRPGSLNHLPDALSRLDTSTPMDVIQSDPEAHPISIGNISLQNVSKDREDWIRAQKEDSHLAPIIGLLTDKSCDIPEPKHRRWLLANATQYVLMEGLLHKVIVTEVDGLETTVTPVVVPTSMVDSVVNSVHSSLPDGAHLGVKLIYPKLRHFFYWRNMYADIEVHIRACVTCQRFRQGARQHLPLQESYCPSEIMEAVAIDAIRLPECDGFLYGLVAVDLLTGFAWAFPLKNIQMETVYRALEEGVFTKFGYPKVLISDGGAEFNNVCIMKLCDYANMRHHICAPYNPQGNAYPERFNRTLISLLATTSKPSDSQPDFGPWPMRIHNVVDVFNRSAAPNSSHSRFYLFMGREPRPVAFEKLGLPDPATLVSADTARALWDNALSTHVERIHKQRTKAREKTNDSRPPAPVYEPGRLVWIADERVQHAHNRTAANKMEPKWLGPYVIVRPLETTVTWIVRPLGGSEQFTRNGKHIKVYTAWPGEPDCLPSHEVVHPEADHDEVQRNIRNRLRPKLSGTQYEVDRVLEHRWTTGSLFFKVKWVEFPDSSNTWEPELNLDCTEKVQVYFATADLRRPPPQGVRGARRK